MVTDFSLLGLLQFSVGYTLSVCGHISDFVGGLSRAYDPV